jgi:hypothetical protein
LGDEMKKNLPMLGVPLAVAQVGIGLPGHTDLKFRYFPTTNFSGIEASVWGIGFQHDIGHWIPFFSKIPFAHLSALAAYNSLKVNYDLSNKGMSGLNQKVNIQNSAYTVQAIVSAKVLFFELYGSLGYVGGSSKMDMAGTYTIQYTNKSSGATITSNLVDPLALEYKNAGMSSTLGVRIHLAVLKIHADYTMAKYNGIGAGISFSFR